MRVFNSDEELKIFEDKEISTSLNKEFFKGCPDCKTDDFLMDIINKRGDNYGDN
jgi:hypothetical protein